MAYDKTSPSPKPPTRDRVLDAAERLLSDGDAAFSMRELAEAAGLSFATPFNQFGSKGAIMLALSARRIEAMHARLAETALSEKTLERVLLAVDIAASVMLASPIVNRAVMGEIGAPSDAPSEVAARSRALWEKALSGGQDLVAVTRPLALAVLPHQLAIAFRGVLSFWTAGEIADDLLTPRAQAAAAAVLLGFLGGEDRAGVIRLLEGVEP